MAKKDASKYLGGASGKAAGALRSRQSRIDAAVDTAVGPAPKKKSQAKGKKK